MSGLPPEDDPIIRGLRNAGIRPLPPRIPGEVQVRRGRRLLFALLAMLALLLFIPAVATRLSDWLWYREIGFERVFLTKIVAQWALGIPAGVIAFMVLYGSARFALAGPTRDGVASRFRDMYARADLAFIPRSTIDGAIRFILGRSLILRIRTSVTAVLEGIRRTAVRH